MRPHIYLLRGQWTCARRSGGWTVWPYGKGNTPLAAYLDWKSRAPRLDTITVRVGVRVAWWVAPYTRLLILAVRITRRAPEMERFERRIMKGIKVKTTVV